MQAGLGAQVQVLGTELMNGSLVKLTTVAMAAGQDCDDTAEQLAASGHLALSQGEAGITILELGKGNPET